MGKRSDKRRAEKRAERQATIDAALPILQERAPRQRGVHVFEDDEQSYEIQTVNIRTTPVAWGLPMDEIVYSTWCMQMFRHAMMPWDDVLETRSTYIPDARNIIHSRFVKHSMCDFLVMVDSDTILPPGYVDHCLDLMQGNKDIRMVGGWYAKKNHENHPIVYRYHPEGVGNLAWEAYDKPGEGLEAVDAAGAGCWVMHRSVAEAIGPKPYNMNEGGEDLILCKKVNQAGFKVWIDWSMRCAHIGSTAF